MNESNRDLLAQVVEKLLTDVLEKDLGTDEEKHAFKEAMEAIDREVALRKLDDSYYADTENRSLEEKKFEASKQEKTVQKEIEEKKMAFEEKKLKSTTDEQVARRKLDEKKQADDEVYRKKDFVKAICIGVGTIVVTFAAPVVERRWIRKFAREICTFEKDYTFTTTPGRSLGGIFRFRK